MGKIKKPFINKDTSQTYKLVYRAHDALSNSEDDANGGDRILAEISTLPTARHTPRHGLPSLKKPKIPKVHMEPVTQVKEDIPKHVGQAALYGVFFDDTEYDYTQHLREIGGGSDGVYVASKAKAKMKQTVVMAPKEIDIHENDSLPSGSFIFIWKYNYV